MKMVKLFCKNRNLNLYSGLMICFFAANGFVLPNANAAKDAVNKPVSKQVEENVSGGSKLQRFTSFFKKDHHVSSGETHFATPTEWIGSVKERKEQILSASKGEINFLEKSKHILNRQDRDYWTGIFAGLGHSYSTFSGNSEIGQNQLKGETVRMDVKIEYVNASLGESASISSTGPSVTQAFWDPNRNQIVYTDLPIRLAGSSGVNASQFNTGSSALNLLVGANWRISSTEIGRFYILATGDYNLTGSTSEASFNSPMSTKNITAGSVFIPDLPISITFNNNNGTATRPLIMFADPVTGTLVAHPGWDLAAIIAKNTVNTGTGSLNSQSAGDFSFKEHGGINVALGFAPKIKIRDLDLSRFMFYVGAGITVAEIMSSVQSSGSIAYKPDGNSTFGQLGIMFPSFIGGEYVDISITLPAISKNLDSINSNQQITSVLPRISAGVDIALSKTLHVRVGYSCGFMTASLDTVTLNVSHKVSTHLIVLI